jgi:general secretion pathway protein C
MSARIAALLVWALVAASIAFWGSRILSTDAARVASAPVEAAREPSPAAFARLLGESAATMAPQVQARATDSRFRLSGVVAPNRPGGPGIALIAIDSKIVRAYRTGETVDGDVVLQTVSLRSATLSSTNGAHTIDLELPLPTPPATGLMRSAPAILAGLSATSPSIPVTPSALTPATTTADEAPAALAVDLEQDLPLTAQASASGLSSGRRQRLRGIGTAPPDPRPPVR